MSADAQWVAPPEAPPEDSLKPAPNWEAPARLEGPRVLLRAVDPAADAPELYAGSHGSPEREAIWSYLGYGPFPEVAAMRRHLEACAVSTDPSYYCVVDRGSGRRLGITSYLRIAPEHRCVEIGHIWYIPEAQRTHVNTEACLLLLSHAFDTLGYRRVEWKCDAANQRSHQAALRLGFRYEGTFRQHRIVKGRNRDTAWFAILDGDWPAVRGRWGNAVIPGADDPDRHRPPAASRS
jgi:RimJ/RimL family protein N-acetyltransferase